MSHPAKLAFASAREELIPGFLEAFEAVDPEFELWVVSEFPPPRGRWIPYRFDRNFTQNLERCRQTLHGRSIHLAAIVLQPRTPYNAMRLLCLRLAPFRTLFYNENLDHYMLRPRALPGILRHGLWRARSLLRWQLRPGGSIYTWAWRFAHPKELRRPWLVLKARQAGSSIHTFKRSAVRPSTPSLDFRGIEGTTIVIPSRDGRALLERLLPVLADQLAGESHEVIVVDNGSSDGSAGYVFSLGMQCLVSEQPLSFAAAVNRGIFAARFSRICLLNNDMVPHPDFFAPLIDAFDAVPDLFCATSQIFFPEGRRREETGKAYFRLLEYEHFPVACQIPLPGEDLTRSLR
ncbi:MAG: glycosyltransferase [Bryobacteraceae bacterium]